jgi:large subunit ribosomal protein L3
MISGFIAKKGQMTNVYTPEGKRITVTKCVVSPMVVTQVKTAEKDGYQAIQIAYGTKKYLDNATSKKISKLKLDIKPQHFAEFDLTAETAPEIGAQITVDSVLTVGDNVSVIGVSKGHGFAGVIKRYGFQRQPVTGGQSDRVRAPGAIGAQTPGKVIKGKKMPGHYGNKIKNIKNLKVISINPELGEVYVSGSIPGALNSWVTIQKTGK